MIVIDVVGMLNTLLDVMRCIGEALGWIAYYVLCLGLIMFTLYLLFSAIVYILKNRKKIKEMLYVSDDE